MKVRSIRPGPSQKTHNANRKKIHILLAALGVLLAGFIVVAVFIGLELTSDDISSIMETPEVAVAAPQDDTQEEATPSPLVGTITYNGKTYQKNDAIVNLLFLGIDSDDEREQQRMGYRSDMMMVCAVDTVNKSATLLSIPRDTYTNVYHIDKNGQIEGEELNRLNAAYAFGGGPKRYSAENAKICIQRFLQRECDLQTPLVFTLDIPINFYASIDMDGIAPLARAVDGIEVKLEEYIPNVGNKGDVVTLNGEKAEEYLRNRHDTSTDFGRTARQRTFMIEMAKKIKKMGAVDAITKLYDKLQAYTRTDLNLDQIIDFAKILNSVNIDKIKMLAIPASPGKLKDGSDVVFHDEVGTLEMLLGIYYTEVS